MALRLKELNPDVEYTYCITPTGDELPEMIDHWNNLQSILGKFTILSSGISLQGLIKKWKRLPNHRQRWCTRVLKIEPYKEFLLRNRPAISYVGLRADEETRQGAVFGTMDDVHISTPLRDWEWGIRDVLSYLQSKNITIPSRTDCARCYHQRLGEWKDLLRFHPEIYEEAVQDEEFTGHTFRSPHRDNWPASLKELKIEFNSDRKIRGYRTTECRVCSL